MHRSDLDDRLKESLKQEFEPAFIQFCIREFSSHTYPERNLAAARMYLFFLKASIEALSDITGSLWESVFSVTYPDDRGALPGYIALSVLEDTEDTPETRSDTGTVARAIGLYCYGAALKAEEDVTFYHTLFVQSWLEYFSKEF